MCACGVYVFTYVNRVCVCVCVCVCVYLCILWVSMHIYASCVCACMAHLCVVCNVYTGYMCSLYVPSFLACGTTFARDSEQCSVHIICCRQCLRCVRDQVNLQPKCGKVPV